MAIQFYCSGCGQAIEVDDEYANRPIACPFCHATVTAPPASQLQTPPQAPVAAAVGSAPAAPQFVPPPAAAAPVTTASAGAARLCTLGMVCGIALFIMPIFWGTLFVIQSDFMTRMQAMQGRAPDPKAQQEEMMQSLRGWVRSNGGENIALSVVSAILIIVGLSSSIAGLVRSDTRRWQAILGLIFCGLCGACTALCVVNGVWIAKGAAT